MTTSVRGNSGFTIIELMAVVSILSILTVVGLAVYSDYAVRGRISEGIVFASEAKTSVTEYFYHNQRMPQSNWQAGLPDAESYDRYDHIRRLELSTSEPFGVITITFKLPSTRSDFKQLSLIPNTRDGYVTWTCLPPDENGIELTQVPPNCRG